MSLRLVQANIEVLVEAQFSSDKLCQGWSGGRVGSWFEVKDRSAQAEPINLSVPLDQNKSNLFGQS